MQVQPHFRQPHFLIEKSNERILIVDDDPDILEFLTYNIRKAGYQVASAANGKLGLEVAVEFKPHLILLDVMMPELDGVESCHRLKQIPELQNTVIAILTARHEEYAQIAGFEAGADDYIQKPIRPRLLLSRIKALLRRYGGNSSEQRQKIIQLGNLEINKERFEVSYGGELIDLPKKEFDILCLLLTRPGKVFSRNEIFRKVWGDDVMVGDRTIDVYISKLREKIGTTFIRTVKGVGYKISE